MSHHQILYIKRRNSYIKTNQSLMIFIYFHIIIKQTSIKKSLIPLVHLFFQNIIHLNLNLLFFSLHVIFISSIIMKVLKIAKVIQSLSIFYTNSYINYIYSFQLLKPLPSYSIFQRLIKNIDNELLKEITKSWNLKLKGFGLIK